MHVSLRGAPVLLLLGSALMGCTDAQSNKSPPAPSDKPSLASSQVTIEVQGMS